MQQAGHGIGALKMRKILGREIHSYIKKCAVVVNYDLVKSLTSLSFRTDVRNLMYLEAVRFLTSVRNDKSALSDFLRCPESITRRDNWIPASDIPE